jgi:LacI family transcriptional regulator
MVHPAQNLHHLRTDLLRAISRPELELIRLRSLRDSSNRLYGRSREAVAEVTTKRIALALQETVALRFSILQGVQDYARTRTDWDLVRTGGSLVLTWQDALAARPDGIIGFVGEQIIPALRATDIPIVCVNSIHNLREFVRVRSDAHAVGALAAKYYLDLGYKEFAFCTDVPYHFYSQSRWKGFRATLQDAGYMARQIRLSERRDEADDTEYTVFSSLPEGTALYCVTDACARRVLNYTEEAGIAVPRQLAVLGTDNDPFFCEGGRTLLSSIDVNHRKTGVEAAATLDRILDGAAEPEDAVLIPPARVVKRASTDPAGATTHPLVAKALNTITARAHDPDFNTEELARMCGVSSRTIGRLFEQQGLRSPYQVLLNARVGNAQRLLQESQLTADEIAFRCGFTDYSSFYRVFKNQVGTSPSAFR